MRCGLILDRDINAARNILKAGLEQEARVETEPLLVKRISKFGRGSKKPVNLFMR
jgi:transposase